VETAGTTRISFLGRLRDHSTLGWAEFDERYRDLLYRYALRCGAAPDEAEDIVQEVELSVFKAMDRFQYERARGRFRSYLRAAVVHAVAKRASPGTGPEIGFEPLDPDEVAEDDPRDAEWEREWQLHRLRNALRSIVNEKEFDPATLEAFRLYVLAGLTAESTATQVGISCASVHQAKCRVLKRLRQKINLEDPSESAEPGADAKKK